MTKGCDNIKNCPNDMSDEAACKLLDIPDSYQIDYAPTQVDEMGEVIKASIMVSVDLTNILRVSENMDIFEVKLILHLSWFDNRLQFNNLKVGKRICWQEKEKATFGVLQLSLKTQKILKEL